VGVGVFSGKLGVSLQKKREKNVPSTRGTSRHLSLYTWRKQHEHTCISSLMSQSKRKERLHRGWERGAILRERERNPLSKKKKGEKIETVPSILSSGTRSLTSWQAERELHRLKRKKGGKMKPRRPPKRTTLSRSFSSAHGLSSRAKKERDEPYFSKRRQEKGPIHSSKGSKEARITTFFPKALGG